MSLGELKWALGTLQLFADHFKRRVKGVCYLLSAVKYEEIYGISLMRNSGTLANQWYDCARCWGSWPKTKKALRYVWSLKPKGSFFRQLLKSWIFLNSWLDSEVVSSHFAIKKDHIFIEFSSRSRSKFSWGILFRLKRPDHGN